MTNYKPFEYALIQMATLVFDSDKESLSTRLAQGETLLPLLKKGNVDGVLAIAKVHAEPSSMETIKVACYDIMDILAGKPTNMMVGLDDCSSGVQHISLNTRDSLGLIAIGAIKVSEEFLKIKKYADLCRKLNLNINDGRPGNFYQIICDLLNESKKEQIQKGKLSPLTRAMTKLGVIPYYYGSNKSIKEHLHGFEDIFDKVYMELVPGAYQFRREMLASWDSTKDHIYFVLPDGFTTYIPVEGDDHQKRTSVDMYIPNKGKKSIAMTVKYKGKRRSSSSGTRGLGAHVIHGMDAYQLRELNRAMAINKVEATKKLANFEVVGQPTNDSLYITNLIEIYRQCNIVSNRFFYLNNKEGKIQVTEEIYQALKDWIEYLPEEGMETHLMNIHDEFKCGLNHVNDMRRITNYIKALEYKGEYFKYINRVFHSRIKVGAFEQEVYDAILNSDYMLS